MKPLLYANVNITFLSYYTIYLVNPSSCMYIKLNCICILNLITRNDEGLTHKWYIVSNIVHRMILWLKLFLKRIIWSNFCFWKHTLSCYCLFTLTKNWFHVLRQTEMKRSTFLLFYSSIYWTYTWEYLSLIKNYLPKYVYNIFIR